MSLITFDIPAPEGSTWGYGSWDAVIGEQVPLWGGWSGTLRKAVLSEDRTSVRLTIETPKDLKIEIAEMMSR